MKILQTPHAIFACMILIMMSQMARPSLEAIMPPGAALQQHCRYLHVLNTKPVALTTFHHLVGRAENVKCLSLRLRRYRVHKSKD